MEKYQRSHSLVEQNHRKAEWQVHTERQKKTLPFTSEETLNKATSFAENHTSISQENFRTIIKHCSKSLLFYDNDP